MEYYVLSYQIEKVKAKDCHIFTLKQEGGEAEIGLMLYEGHPQIAELRRARTGSYNVRLSIDTNA